MSDFIFFEESWNKEGAESKDPLKVPKNSEVNSKLNKNKLKPKNNGKNY